MYNTEVDVQSTAPGTYVPFSIAWTSGPGPWNASAHCPKYPIRHWRAGKERMLSNRTYPLPNGRFRPLIPIISDIARMIIEDYARWQGSLGDFLTQEPQRVNVSPNQTRNVLEITAMISKRKSKSSSVQGQYHKASTRYDACHRR